MKMSLGRVTALAAVPVLLLAVAAGSASARPASGSPPPPKHFEAQSASFISAQTGFVLGSRNCGNDINTPCPALLEKTINGGKTWTQIKTTPKVDLAQPFNSPPRNAVSAVRFMNASDGWLFNPGLWATTDGGKHWKSVSMPGLVATLEASGGEAFASVQPWLTGPNQAQLYQSAVASGKWTKVARVQPENTLTVSGHSAWTGQTPNLWTTANSGKTWHKLSFNCPSRFPQPGPMGAANAKDISIVCYNQPTFGSTQKMVWVSVNGGAKFTPAPQQPGQAGMVYLLAMPVNNPKEITIAAASGASYLYTTINGGQTWGVQIYKDGGTGFTDLAYVTGSTGYVIRFMGTPVLPYSKGLWKTTNAGGSWKPVSIP